MISMMFHIIVFRKLGFFNPTRFGEDEHFYYRFFTLFENSAQSVPETFFISKYGFFFDILKYVQSWSLHL